MHQQDLFNRPLAHRLRNQGIARVGADNEDWTDAARAAFEEYAATGVKHFIGEDFRAWWATQRSYRPPRSPNAWGALTFALSKRGRVRMTGKVRAAASSRSHARKMLEWEIL